MNDNKMSAFTCTYLFSHFAHSCHITDNMVFLMCCYLWAGVRATFCCLHDPTFVRSV